MPGFATDALARAAAGYKSRALPGTAPGAGPRTVAQPDPNTTISNFANNARTHGLGGSITDPSTGATYSIPAGAPASAPRVTETDTFDADLNRVGSHLPPMPAPFVPGADVDSSDAERNAFARAKDRIGVLGRGAMDSLSRAMGSRNLAGSSIEGKGIAAVTSGTNAQLGDVVRDQAIEGVTRARQVADRNYAGGLTARGQDIAATNNRQSHLQGLMALLRASRKRTVY